MSLYRSFLRVLFCVAAGLSLILQPSLQAASIRLLTTTIATDTSAQRANGSSALALDFALPADEGLDQAVLVQFNTQVNKDIREKLDQAGLNVRGYVPENALLIMGDTDQLQALATWDEVYWMGHFKEDYKKAPECASFTTRAASRGESEVTVLISILRPDRTATVKTFIESLGGEVSDAGQSTMRGTLRAKIGSDLIDRICAQTDVEWVEPEPVITWNNNVATQSNRMNVATVWDNHGLTGAGQVVGVADSGLDMGCMTNMHPDFEGRVIGATGWYTNGIWHDALGHGTHVAGSILGSGAACSNGLFHGVAHEAALYFQALGNPTGGPSVYLPADLNNLFVQAWTNQSRLHNNSWGDDSKGVYTLYARQTDEFIWDHPDMLIFFSAGNSGEDLDPADGIIDASSIGAPGTAKNCMTVGAAESLRPAGSGGYSSRLWGTTWSKYYATFPISEDYISTPDDGIHQGMAAFSSRGPCADGRVKPDIVAPGTDIISCRSRYPDAWTLWGTGSGVLDNIASNFYMFSGGTSMSTPLTTGCGALVREYYVRDRGLTNPCASLVKATLMAGAESLYPGQYGTNEFAEIPVAWPNSVEGYGQVNMGQSLYPENNITNLMWNRIPIDSGETQTFDIDVCATGTLKAVLAWSDYPGAVYAAQTLVNDLDLKVIAPDGTTAYPRDLVDGDHTNNTEGIMLDISQTGHCQLVVSAYNVPMGPQPYSLFVQAPAASIVSTSQIVGIWSSPDILYEGTIPTISALISTNTFGLASVATIYRINSNNWHVVPMTRSEEQSGGLIAYSTELPSFVAGDVVDYYIYILSLDMQLITSETNQMYCNSSLIYAATNGLSIWPYDTPETAVPNWQLAIDLLPSDGELRILPGTYHGETLVLNSPIRMQGVGSRDETIYDAENAHQCMTLLSDSTVSGITFIHGHTTNGYGGGIVMTSGTISNCVIRNCTTTKNGGGIDMYGGLLTHSLIMSNQCDVYGGGVLIHDGMIRNCIIRDNTALEDGGGVEVWGGSISNCTIAYNTSETVGGGLDIGDVVNTIANSIIVSNSAPDGPNFYEWLPMNISYSCIQPLTDGEGVISVDPQFADPFQRDLHLKSTAGRMLSNGTWTNDVLNSPCIDSGNPTDSFDAESSPNGLRINMGAYGNTVEASRTDTNTFYVIVQSDFDVAEPANGLWSYSSGELIHGFVTTNCIGNTLTQYCSQGWVLTGGADTNGEISNTATSLIFSITNNTVLQWQWSTNFWLETTAGEHGSISGSTNGWHEQGSLITLTPIPDSYYTFSQWSGSCSTMMNPLMFRIDASKELRAEFMERTTSDGIPELWYVQYGITNDFEQAGQEDPDADGAISSEEYIAGTNPTNTASVLQLLQSFDTETPSLHFQWTTQSNRTYTLYSAEQLGSGITQIVYRSYFLYPVPISVDIPMTHSNQFYRIGVRQGLQ